LVFELEVIRGLSALSLLPFIEPIGQDQAPTLLERGAKGWLCGHGVRTGVGKIVPDAGLFRPRGDVTPPEKGALTLPAYRFNPACKDRLRRGDVVYRGSNSPSL
jgi:hypothetical protein